MSSKVADRTGSADISKPISPQNMKNLAFIRLLQRHGLASATGEP